MPLLAQQRCFNHRHREAVARCPECARYFCRECVTEHAERLLCARCLEAAAGPRARRRRWSGPLLRLALPLLGLLLLWMSFFYLGRLLLIIPSAFHEGTLWKDL